MGKNRRDPNLLTYAAITSGITIAVALAVTGVLPGPGGTVLGIAATIVLTVAFGLLYARLWGGDDA